MQRTYFRYEGERAFELSSAQFARLRQWTLEIDTNVAMNQIETGKGIGGRDLTEEEISRIRESVERGHPLPDYGMIGGAYRYTFAPNSIGTAVTVENSVSGDVLDLSEHELW